MWHHRFPMSPAMLVWYFWNLVHGTESESLHVTGEVWTPIPRLPSPQAVCTVCFGPVGMFAWHIKLSKLKRNTIGVQAIAGTSYGMPWASWRWTQHTASFPKQRNFIQTYPPMVFLFPIFPVHQNPLRSCILAPTPLELNEWSSQVVDLGEFFWELALQIE